MTTSHHSQNGSELQHLYQNRLQRQRRINPLRAWVSSPAYDVAIRALVDARNAAGLSQAALAKRLGKPPSYVAKIEIKERRVDVVEYIEFLRATGADEAAALQAIWSALVERN